MVSLGLGEAYPVGQPRPLLRSRYLGLQVFTQSASDPNEGPLSDDLQRIQIAEFLV